MRYNLRTNKFEEIELNTDKVAFIGSNGFVEWEEVKTIVEKLVLEIESLKLPKGYPIFIYGHKQIEFPLSIIACLKSQHPFVSLDQLYPKERILEIIEETGTNVLIDCSKGDNKLKEITTISFDSERTILVKKAKELTVSKVPVFDANPLSYILFTSGSTGKPKGVLIREKSLLSLVDWIKTDDFEMSEKEVFVNQSPFSFDVSLFDTFSALNYGATMLMVSQELAKNTEEFKAKLLFYKATFWTSTPSFIYLYQRENWFNNESIPTLKKFLFAGEPLPVSIVSNLHTSFLTEKVWNAYGPTEATVITTLLKVDKTTVLKYDKLPIGFSKPTSTMMTIPTNSTEDNLGELVIIGENVAEGYLNRKEQTADRFFTVNGEKAYKTGDLGYVKNGLIFCNGRNDDQIKFNGYRIELEEISEKIISFGNVDEVRTIGLKRNDKVVRMVSLYQSLTEVDIVKLRRYLTGNLPHYMIPSDFLKVDDFPKNISGKIERNKLQEFYLEEKKKTIKCY